MADNTIILQGSFTSDGNPRIIDLRSDVDWMEINNYTIQAAGTSTTNSVFYWQRGMAAGTGLARTAAGVSALVSSPNGFTLVDTSQTSLGSAVATTAGTNVTQPVISTGTTTGLLANSTVVRIYHAAWPHLSGLDILCGTVVGSTSFAFAATLATAPGVAGSTGTYKILGTPNLYAPTRRIIANITGAVTPTVTTLAPHGLVAGQTIRLVVPSVCSMVQAHGLTATVTSVTTVYSFVIDLDTSGFTTFTFPTAAQAPCTYAECVPFGETASSTYVNLLNDAVYNVSQLGMYIGGGADTPGGANTNVMYWRAGKSFSNN